MLYVCTLLADDYIFVRSALKSFCRTKKKRILRSFFVFEIYFSKIKSKEHAYHNHQKVVMCRRKVAYGDDGGESDFVEHGLRFDVHRVLIIPLACTTTRTSPRNSRAWRFHLKSVTTETLQNDYS